MFCPKRLDVLLPFFTVKTTKREVGKRNLDYVGEQGCRSYRGVGFLLSNPVLIDLSFETSIFLFLT